MTSPLIRANAAIQQEIAEKLAADNQQRRDEIDLMVTTSQQYNHDAKQLHLFLDQNE